MTGPSNDAAEQSCPECGAAVGDTDQFCEGCGAGLRVFRGATAERVGSQHHTCADCGHDVAPDEEYCRECGLLGDDGTHRVEITLAGLAGVSDRGHVHARNEDAMALGGRVATAGAGPVLAAVVCDGVSSVEHPELASRTATVATLDVLLTERPAGRSAADHVRAAVAEAARQVAKLPRTPGRGAPSCTLVAALVEETDGTDEQAITLAWVGDSRGYWLAPAGAAEPARALTTDHSWAVEVVALGELDEQAAAADPRAHAITRWMGADSSDEPSVVTLRPAGPGVLLLCSDGLWNYLPDAADLAGAAAAAGTEPHAIADELTAYALDAGGRDNITVVVVPIRGAG